ncbi:hypothetical protein A3C37_02070 [Candidatus Peribacteria bacterium RIFCSPHIGHO2_02_FULL_53_20]|nr:MAG: hypothetical protein A3C37_02070 [Candidatus Peribacteria bacterium RIFCSPHIGHO2_02_FULL_53_20]OGJ66573.1 MAG: hypothetical protein A3B61_01510 [Candidatus Peribacteria bacterium RIFCSPLOWO2_01_FULL_53_10]
MYAGSQRTELWEEALEAEEGLLEAEEEPTHVVPQQTTQPWSLLQTPALQLGTSQYLEHPGPLHVPQFTTPQSALTVQAAEEVLRAEELWEEAEEVEETEEVEEVLEEAVEDPGVQLGSEPEEQGSQSLLAEHEPPLRHVKRTHHCWQAPCTGGW